MLNKLKKSNNEGFTIIEVMIVLAIAGLILLIVFLAVPALQRSSRNTQRKTDIGRIGSAATTVVSNNSNSMAALTTGALTTETGSNLSYYQTSGIIANAPLASGGTAANPANIDKVLVVPNGKCSGSNAVYANRAIAVLYSSEGGSGGATPICVDQ